VSVDIPCIEPVSAGVVLIVDVVSPPVVLLSVLLSPQLVAANTTNAKITTLFISETFS
jgi:hypothetical protein